ncbi:MAG: 2,3-bisphosphoglycerate-independent phosphoglycerate mutase [Gammaproteobacteria bacterium]|jgi:2,3-bisphosphoglycerate-independent phosphoglycerate mutase
MAEERTTTARKVVLIILDGFGVNPSKVNNAVHEAATPRLDSYFAKYPHAVIEASGRAVGLPVGQMGNSEVGHLTIGSGTIIRQDLVRIDDAIQDKSFFDKPALIEAVNRAKEAGRPLHLLGLVSDGGVHSHIRHLNALIRMCRKKGVQPVVHMITDGRDTPPKSAINYLPDLEKRLNKAEGYIATVTGRYYAMDRDNRWDRTKLAFDAIIHGQGNTDFKDAESAIRAAYENEQADEFIKPCVLNADGLVKAGDPLVFFNFRNDRPRQLAAALALEEFDGFDRGDYQPITVTCLTEYDPRLLSPIVFPPERPATTLAEVVALAGYKQFHCAETEKYAHVTFFLNGGREEPYAGEDRVMVNSPDVATYDQKPEMSAAEVADEVIAAMQSDKYQFVVVNFANGDMVGHTAVPAAVIQAVETLDREAGRVLDAAVSEGYTVMLTADHGNCDEYVDPITGEPHTQHTVYPVPFLLVDRSNWRLATGAGLSDLTPTILQLIGLQQPEAMKGRSMLLEELPRPE